MLRIKDLCVVVVVVVVVAVAVVVVVAVAVVVAAADVVVVDVVAVAVQMKKIDLCFMFFIFCQMLHFPHVILEIRIRSFSLTGSIGSFLLNLTTHLGYNSIVSQLDTQRRLAISLACIVNVDIKDLL